LALIVKMTEEPVVREVEATDVEKAPELADSAAIEMVGESKVV